MGAVRDRTEFLHQTGVRGRLIGRWICGEGQMPRPAIARGRRARFTVWCPQNDQARLSVGTRLSRDPSIYGSPLGWLKSALAPSAQGGGREPLWRQAGPACRWRSLAVSPSPAPVPRLSGKAGPKRPLKRCSSGKGLVAWSRRPRAMAVPTGRHDIPARASVRGASPRGASSIPKRSRRSGRSSATGPGVTTFSSNICT